MSNNGHASNIFLTRKMVWEDEFVTAHGGIANGARKCSDKLLRLGPTPWEGMEEVKKGLVELVGGLY